MKKVSSLINWEKELWVWFIINVINKCQETTALFHCFQYVVKYLKFNNSNKFPLKTIILLISSNQSSFKGGGSCIYSFYPLNTKYVSRLTTVLKLEILDLIPTLHKKWNFPLKIPSVNVIKSAVFSGFGHIYWRKFWMESVIFCSGRSLDTSKTCDKTWHRGLISLVDIKWSDR